MADSKNIRLTLKDVRGSFLHLTKPQEAKNDDGKLTGYTFNGAFLIDKLVDGKKNPMAEQIADAMKKAIEAKWPGQNMKIPAEYRCFVDGEPKDEDSDERTPLYEGYEGKYVLKANQRVTIEEWEEDKKNPVQLLGPRKGADGKFPRLKGAAAEELFYSGGFYDIVVSIWAYDGSKRKHKNRVSCTLEVVKFKRHGEAFGAGPVNAEDYLDDEEADELDDGLGDGGSAASSDDDDDLLA